MEEKSIVAAMTTREIQENRKSSESWGTKEKRTALLDKSRAGQQKELNSNSSPHSPDNNSLNDNSKRVFPQLTDYNTKRVGFCYCLTGSPVTVSMKISR
jgi:hypothetical protein